MQDPRERAKRFIRKHPVAAKAIAAAALKASKTKDPAALIYEGVSDLANASAEDNFLGMDIGELQDMLIDVVGDLADDLF